MRRALIGIVTFIITLFAITASTAFADKESAYTLRVSYYEPNDAAPGFAFGGSAGRSFDGIVTLGIGTDVYVKNFVRDTPVATQEYESGINTTTIQREVQYTTVIFPIMAELTVKIPIVWKLAAFGHGGLGFEFLWNKEQNFDTGEVDSRWFAGWTWLGGAGLQLKLGNDTALYAEGFYKRSRVRRNQKEITEGLPVFEEVDLSGLGIRMGIALEL
jgi:hypothetical protein